ncbi:DUF305 domain-containing protein [Streptomyces sp. RTd22]|uniref:DUF305 domain-containing protein n=1 Tax=Streptomyces sp. RTd22 TaxID=1841249 RepID=UPI0007C46D85|nr:DUF305 domain-containing protein [Streptomyces sp. RTd22]
MTRARPLLRRTTLASLTAVTALTLGACGGNDNAEVASTASAPATTATGRHNQADVTFAQQMIVHHRQAIEMADMAQEHAHSRDVKSLAVKIDKEQEPEIKTMTGWLKSWSEKVPEGLTMPSMGHRSPSGTPSMPGMMDDQQMRDMTHTSGKAFDTMFLTMMIKHHQGAIDMARTEKKQGTYGPARTLAGDIITTQTAQITQMRKMLGTN